MTDRGRKDTGTVAIKTSYDQELGYWCAWIPGYENDACLSSVSERLAVEALRAEMAELHPDVQMPTGEWRTGWVADTQTAIPYPLCGHRGGRLWCLRRANHQGLHTSLGVREGDDPDRIVLARWSGPGEAWILTEEPSAAENA